MRDPIVDLPLRGTTLDAYGIVGTPALADALRAVSAAPLKARSRVPSAASESARAALAVVKPGR